MQANKPIIWVAGALAATALIAGCESTAYESNSQGVDDATISANVKAALVQDPETRSSNISVNTLHGTVELSGFVDTPAQRHEAARVASNIGGVQSVDNELQINNQGEVVGTASSDGAITSNVQSALAANSTTAGAQITVTTYHGVVQLAGFVDSRAQRDAAGNIAASVQGVRTVDNDLRLTPQ
jgi:hyperosmotically inducible periplasmic protein